MNILLVEDEPPILRDLKSQIELLSILDISVNTARNGKEAVDYLNVNGSNIHLVITDIHMPVIDGLELISYISAHYTQIICIILTGYSEFEYAKRAINLGVFDYLLKPIDENQLANLLKRVQEALCIKELTKNVETNRTTPKKPNTCNHDNLKTTYAVAVICLGSFPIHSTDIPLISQTTWNFYQLKQTLTALIPDNSFWIIDGSTPKEKNIIFTFHDIEEEEQLLLLNKYFKPMLFHSVPFSVAYYTNIKDMKLIHKTVSNLRSCLNDNIILGKSQIINYKKMNIKKDLLLFEIQNIIKTLILTFSSLQIHLFQTELQHLTSQMKSMELTQKKVYQCLYDFIYPCLTDSKHQEFTKHININEFISDIIVLSSTYDSLYHNLYSAFYDIFESILNTKDNNMNKEQLLMKLDSYITLNYNQPINTLTISDKFNFSPAYLSKMFREYKQMSPSEYIMFLRIEKAQKLFLSNPELKIKEVSSLVGYEDSLYFSKVFKKVTGKSPKQYTKDPD